MEFGGHHVHTHVREKDLSVVYTNDPAVPEDYINTMEQLLAEDDKYKVVGFDLQYTNGHPRKDQKVVVAQLCILITSSSTNTAWPQGLAIILSGLSTAPTTSSLRRIPPTM